MNEIKKIDCGDGKIDFLPIDGGIINTVENGVVRTIKANYYKTSFANLTRSGSFGATGGIEKAKTAGDRMAELKTIVAMRGRNPENPSDRMAGAKTEQRLELNGDGVCNTLTSVQKDNLLLEAKPECTERFFNQALETFVENDCEPGDTINAYNKTVDKSGLCPTLTTRPEGFKTAILPVVENNNSIKIKQATKQGYIECKAGGVADFSYPESKLRRGRVQGGGDVSPTLTSSNLGVCKVESRYRIRKLTPRECWRLMGFSDEDFDKAAAVNSNTQLYKQAGNSIVKNVLMAIFGKMVEQGK